ncbi:hypothetical protein IF1G_08092 [Cordyceps javanica]|uniref:Uncharacterized protein n=1 Tax=Cordyceps javanica TaxID=43265 RepID=A0A545UVL9_9HYPO|nr:hypothetical protein IF1G_08092 [Cordyceps javanica]
MPAVPCCAPSDPRTASFGRGGRWCGLSWGGTDTLSHAKLSRKQNERQRHMLVRTDMGKCHYVVPLFLYPSFALSVSLLLYPCQHRTSRGHPVTHVRKAALHYRALSWKSSHPSNWQSFVRFHLDGLPANLSTTRNMMYGDDPLLHWLAGQYC